MLGDGALTGGLAYEALNNAGQSKTNFIVVLNDNEMSIAPNVGAIDKYLGALRWKPLYHAARETRRVCSTTCRSATRRARRCRRQKKAAMRFVSSEPKAPVIFEELGFRYIGPVDGHDHDALVEVLSDASSIPGPVLLHVHTVKGKGFDTRSSTRARSTASARALRPREGKIDKQSARQTFREAFADALSEIAERDARVIGITAAMPDGTRLSKFAKRFRSAISTSASPRRTRSVSPPARRRGVASPVCAIYSTFLQRAYDQVVHDVVIQRLPVVFAIDRAGFVGDDGPTHMGLYDIAYMRTLPDMT